MRIASLLCAVAVAAAFLLPDGLSERAGARADAKVIHLQPKGLRPVSKVRIVYPRIPAHITVSTDEDKANCAPATAGPEPAAPVEQGTPEMVVVEKLAGRPLAVRPVQRYTGFKKVIGGHRYAGFKRQYSGRRYPDEPRRYRIRRHRYDDGRRWWRRLWVVAQ